MTENNILSVMHEAVRKALDEVAEAEIQKLTEHFESELRECKSELLGKMVSEIQIMSSRDSFTGKVTVQIVIGGG